MRTATDLFILACRDMDKLEKVMGNDAWIMGRSILIDFAKYFELPEGLT
jgi:hypothetical protein